MTLADRIANEIEAVARDAERIQALSRTQPHVFAEQKDDVARRLKKLATTVRDTFGGAPARIHPGFVTSRRGSRVRVEVRRRAA